MLRQLRKKKTAKRILWVLAILIVPAFVLWGAGSAIRSKQRGPSYVGKIYGKKITFEKFAESYKAYYHRLMLSSGGDAKLLDQMKKSININRMVWARLIMLAEAKRQNIKVTDKDIIDAITSSTIFTRNGIFNKELYNHIMQNNIRTTPREFEEETRENIAISRLRDKVLEDVAISDDEIYQEYKKRSEKIKISFVLVNPQDFLKDVKVDEKQLKTFYQENKDTLRKGSEVNLRYLQIDSQDTELLYKISEQINNNKDFNKIAEENNLGIKETGSFGMEQEIPNIGWSYEITQAAFALEEGMTSFPIHTQKGYYVINVKEKRTGYTPSFQEAESILKKKLVEKESEALAGASASDIYKDIDAVIKQGGSLQNALKKLGLKINESKPFSRRDYIEGVGQAQLLKKIAFTVQKGKVVAPVKCEKGFVIFMVDEFIPADEEKFEQEKEKLKDQLLIQKQGVAFEDWFDKISKNTELNINLDLLPQ